MNPSIDDASFQSENPGYADLHIHSLFSDGVLHPRSIVQTAYEKGLRAVSITDHDSIDGVEAAMDEGDQLGIEVIPGVELTAMCQDREIHILGYLFDLQDSKLKNIIRDFRHYRMIRYQRILNHLKEAGVVIRPECLESVSLQSSIGRLHIAEALVSSGVTSTVQNAFRYYLSKGAVAYEEKYPVSPESVIDVLHKAGGVAVLAHPSLQLKESDMMAMIWNGLDGIETIHPRMDQAAHDYFQRIAAQYGLAVSGGSDSHGRNGFPEIGDYKTPLRNVHRMKEIISGKRAVI